MKLMLEESCARVRVLVVDDEPEIREILCDLLGFSYECAAVSSAEEALAHLRAEKRDLVISDITMGGISGLEMIPHVLAPSTTTSCVRPSAATRITSKSWSSSARWSWTAPSRRSKTPTARRSSR